jgi:hypothetical protein
LRCRYGIGPLNGGASKSKGRRMKDGLVPRWLTCCFRRARHPSSVLGSAESRILAIRDRLNIIKQTILRNEHFAPSTIPSRDREHLLTASLPITSVHPPAAWRAYSNTVASAEIDEAAVGPRRGTVLALRNADPLKRGETVPRGPRGRRRARFFTAGEGLTLFTRTSSFCRI